jgi:hypothetical protein
MIKALKINDNELALPSSVLKFRCKKYFKCTQICTIAMLTMHHAVVVLENEPLITAQNGIAVKTTDSRKPIK